MGETLWRGQLIWQDLIEPKKLKVRPVQTVSFRAMDGGFSAIVLDAATRSYVIARKVQIIMYPKR